MNIHEYYDSIAEVSVLTKEAIESVRLAQNAVQHGLYKVNCLKKHGETPISALSNVTINDVHRNFLFFELLLNQTLGVINTLTFQELVELTSYLTNEEDL